MMEPHSEREPAPREVPDAGENTGTDDRRGAARHLCNIETEGYALGPHGNEAWVATIANISATGIGLVVRHRIKPGTVLVIKLQSGNLRISRPLPVRVMHIRPHSDDTWLAGCAFVRRLREEDLRSLL